MGESEKYPPAGEPEPWTAALHVVRRTVACRLALHDAEDACSQALLEVMRYRGRVEDIESWQGLCATVARRVCARSGRPDAFRPFGEVEPADDRDTERAMAAWFQDSFLPRLASCLTGRQDDVLQRLLRGQTIGRIARDLGIPRKSVRESARQIVKKGRAFAKICPPRNTTEVASYAVGRCSRRSVTYLYLASQEKHPCAS